MRSLVGTLFLLVAVSASAPAQADPYRWCAQYGGRGASNCYFLTWEQCEAARAGNGGFCNRNVFYDGRPVTTPEDGIRRTRRHSMG